MKLKPGKYNIIVEILCLLLLCGNTMYLILNWAVIQTKIPGHYNAAGEIDRWGEKGELIFMLVLNWVLYIFLTVLEQFPQIWNTGVDITEENRERIYRILRNMLSTAKFLMVVDFVFINIRQTTLVPMPGWFLPAMLGLLFGSIIYYMIKLVKNR